MNSNQLTMIEFVDICFNIAVAMTILAAAKTIWEQNHRWDAVRILFVWMLAALAGRWVGDALFYAGAFTEDQRHTWRIAVSQPILMIGLLRFIANMRASLNVALKGPRIAIVCIDTEGFIVHWNFAATRLLGWREVEVVGRLLENVVVPKRSRAKHRKGIQELKQASNH